MASPEEAALHAYVDAFNRHDLAAVMECFTADAVILDMSGQRHEGTAQIRAFYEWQFKAFPDGRCDIERITGEGCTGTADTTFHGTHAKSGTLVVARGPEVVEFSEGKVTNLHDHHQLTSA
jgi:taurine dehydrogenase small subunit